MQVIFSKNKNDYMLEPHLARKVMTVMEKEERMSLLDVVKKVDKDQIEVWGLFCACMAWGGLNGKIKSLSKFIETINFDFLSFINKPKIQPLRLIYPNKPQRLLYFCRVLDDLLKDYGSIKNLVKKEKDVKSAIFRLAFEIGNRFKKISKEMLPSLPILSSPKLPESLEEKRRQSALKRYCMFFRWMVRDKPPDLGLWKFFDKKDLFHPLDTHVARILYRWKVLPDMKTNWLNVERVTEYFRRVFPSDPLKFDYHLVTFGQKICTKNNPRCEECLIFKNGFNCRVKV